MTKSDIGLPRVVSRMAWVRRHDEYDDVERSESCCGSGKHQNAERIRN